MQGKENQFKAITDFKKCTQLKSDDCYCWYYLAVSQTNIGRFSEAENSLKMAKKHNRSSFDEGLFSYQLGLVYQNQGKLEEALFEFDHAIEAEPKRGNVEYLKGRA